MSYKTTNFTIAGHLVQFPEVAAGVAIKNAAKRFETAFDLPTEAAFAMSAAIVDPADVRGQIDAKSPFAHLQTIQTPDGYLLLAQQTRVWTSMISGDGGNGRSRYALQTANIDGVRPRPWPIGRHHKPAVVDYHPRSLTDMTTAVRLSAKQIRSQDLETQIGQNARGVWNPPVVVLARAYVTHQDESVEERWFLHTLDGSTRVEACHQLTGVDAGAPLERSDDALEHLRGVHRELLERFETTPTSLKTLGAARGATMPALIVVGAVASDMDTHITGDFPAIINDYVESVHVQPRPFTEAAQSNVLGERFVLTLQGLGRMTSDDAEAILGRDPDVGGKPSVRAAKLVHAVCSESNDSLLRGFLITAPGVKLTKAKRAKLIGPLVVRQFAGADTSSAERALMRSFTPDLLMSPWSILGMDSESLRDICLSDLKNGDFATSALAELMARGGPALCASGLLLGDQGSTVEEITELRGHVDKVVDALAKNAGGVNVLADAVAWADGDRTEKPRQFDPDGNQKLDANGDLLHFSTAWQSGNMGVRALALCKDGKIPREKVSRGRSPEAPVDLSPEARYHINEEALLEYLGRAETTLSDLYAATDGQGVKLIERLGLQQRKIYQTFPDQLSKLYARFGNEDVVFQAFNEDELPEENWPNVYGNNQDDESLDAVEQWDEGAADR